MGSGMPDDALQGQRMFVKLSSKSTGIDCSAAEAAADGSKASGQKPKIQEIKQPASCSYADGASASPLGSPSSPTCPMSLSDREAFNPATGMPAALSNEPHASTSLSSSHAPQLQTARQMSTIPMAPLEAAAVPKHQQPAGSASTQGAQGDSSTAAAGKWVYPSEQMFFNAMKRKGWDPNAEDMSAVVAIHNSVNERAWQELMVWERLHACECAEPRLKKFMGRPSDYSPKARILNFVGFALPFDRHDWVVDRCGKEVRYVIDFYNGAPRPGVPAAMFLDVRPALDTLGAAWDRLSMQFSWALSGRWRGEE